MPDRFQVTKADEDTALDYNQDESASGKLLGDIHDETLGENYGSYTELTGLQSYPALPQLPESRMSC
ncbi:hypothetical protein M5D96_007160 [Drosophila gunungcola]|uniref:Uncharacterized protein n=1 Tax=Drosophila gunungcola TaxID=103775 RepID=A0A9P9YMH0_9MUSC|nr:hypothetical protein M5D96_007160 [Drosophila gunungcola]